MKKRRKKSKKIFLIIIMIIIVTIGAYKYYQILNYHSDNDNHEKIIDDIILNNDTLNNEFLTWIYNEYGLNTLNEINNEIKNNTYINNTWHNLTGKSYIVLNHLYNNNYDNNTKIIDKTGDTTMSFIGDVSLADNWYIMPKYDERKKGIYGILSEDTVKILTESDISVANNEFTISTRGEKIPGKLYSFRASPERIPIYNEMGIDLLTLANNHVYDFGDIAFNDMIDSLNEYKMPYIGAGKNIDEAKRPYYFIINGYKIAFINATRAEKNILTPEATDNSGGVFRCYDPTNLINLIKDTKEKSDYIITLIHWGREDSHELEDVQIDTSKKYIDAGSDIIIGTHAHVLQGIEFYNNKPIIYNIGDFIFNNENKDTGIFQIKLLNNGNMEYNFIPARQSNEYTEILSGNEKQRVINNINSWSNNANIDSTGKITQK